MTMVERVARALFDDVLSEIDGECAPWERAHPEMRARMLKRARAALGAARELSEAEINACPLEPLPLRLKYFRAMIDAALTPPKSP